ncbi:MAG: cation-translocating P-type ATPase [Planctomycetia bacterium]
MGVAREVTPAGEGGAPPWHALARDEVLARLAAEGERGLAQAEAARRLALQGENRLPEPAQRSRLALFLEQFRSLLVGVLAVAGLLAWLLGEPSDALAIAAILVLNGVLGYAQERGAARALEGLRRLSAPGARVRREGVLHAVAAAHLVPGDLVELAAGDAVPADLRLLRSADVRAVEAALTGEPEAVRKDAGAQVPAQAPLAERSTLLFQGTSLATGEALGVVVATGLHTELGRIAALVGRAPEVQTPLQVRLAAFGRWLVLAAGVAVALVFALGLLHGLPLDDMLMTALGLAVAAVPEGLPAVVTIALALGVARMASHGALVRRLAAVETLGCTSVICTDKTGTLTVGHMTVAAVLAPGLPQGEQLDVEAQGYGPPQAFRRADGVAVPPGAQVQALLQAAAAACTARLAPAGRDPGSREPAVLGDPMEGALLAAALGVGVRADDLDREQPVLLVRPFESARQRMAVVRAVAGEACAYVKGSPEALLARSSAWLGPDGSQPMDGAMRAQLEALNAREGARGRRVLAVARRVAPRGTLDGDGGSEDPEQGLTFLGLVALADPPRPEAREAVAACRRAGIRVVMITGDQPATALAVARELGIAQHAGEVVHGSELEALDEAALRARSATAAVYARTTPAHKLRIVQAWQAQGAVVAMTGDGVNDAPALKGADIGVAMGKGGTDVAKDASAMVLLDDRFATLVAAVAEGRRIFDNIRKSLLYLLGGNAGEILVVAGAVLAGLPLPLLPLQLLWINLVTDGLPALALAVDPVDPDVLRRPPRRADAPLADRAFVGAMLASAVLAAAVVLGVFVGALELGLGEPLARSLAFATLVVEELLRAFVVRSRTRIVWELGIASNPRLLGVVALTFLLQALAMQWAPLAGLSGLTSLSAGQAALVLGLGAVPSTVLELAKLARRAISRGQGPAGGPGSGPVAP